MIRNWDKNNGMVLFRAFYEKEKFMKKTTAALAVMAALLVGNPSYADDLPLPGGHVLPLGRQVTVKRGEDSYFAKPVARMLSDPEIKKQLGKTFDSMDLFPVEPGKSSEELAEITWKLMQKGRFYQLKTEKADAYHQALVVSVAIDREDWVKMNETQAILHKKDPEKYPPAETEKDFRKAFLNSLAKGNEEKKERKEIVLPNGDSCVMISLYIDSEQEGYRYPFYGFMVGTADDKKAGLTIIFTNQVTGRVMEPVLKKGMEGIR